MPQYSGMFTLSQASQAIREQNWPGIAPPNVEYLVVAGGGGAGGAGGGAGGSASFGVIGTQNGSVAYPMPGPSLYGFGGGGMPAARNASYNGKSAPANSGMGGSGAGNDAGTTSTGGTGGSGYCLISYWS